MKSKLEPQAAKQAAHLLAKAARFDKGFRRQYPLLVEYVDGRKPIEECTMNFYRQKIQAHLQLIEHLKGEAARLGVSIGGMK